MCAFREKLLRNFLLNMQIKKHLDKNNLHHAYLIEGEREEVIPDVLAFLSDIGVSVVANPDFLHIAIDSFPPDFCGRNFISCSTQC